jgi:UDP-glucose 4-epimerase
MPETLIAGSSGFIGSHLCQKMPQAQKFDIRSGQDGLNFDIVKEYASGKDVIFHLANIPAHRLSVENPYEIAKNNYLLTLNFAEACRVCDVKKMVFASSCGVYGKLQPPFREDMNLQPDTPYGVTKKASEELLKMYHDMYGIDIIIVRPSNVWGDGDYLHEPEQVIPTWIKNAKSGKPLILYGEETTRDFTHISDFVEGITLASSANRFNIFNISSGKEIRLLDVAQAISEDVVVKQLPNYEASRWFAENKKAKEMLGWRLNIDFWPEFSKYCQKHLGKQIDISRFALGKSKD